MLLAFVVASICLVPPIFIESFSEPGVAKRFDDAHRIDQFSLVADPINDSNQVLRINLDEGDHYGGSLRVLLREHMDAEPTRLSFRYRLWIDPNWTTAQGGKLPGFGGTYGRAGWGGKPSDGRNGWSARGMFGKVDEDGRVPVGSYIYHADMVERAQTYGTSEWWDVTLERGRWHTIEQEIQLDTVGDAGGNADGWLKAWVDGELVFDRENLHVRDTDALRIESVWFNVYHGGKEPAPRDTYLLIDDVWVGASR